MKETSSLSLPIKSQKKGWMKMSKKKYPYFGKSVKGTIVLFTSENSGVCLSSESPTHPLSEPRFIGEYRTDWKEGLFNKMKVSKIDICEERKMVVEQNIHHSYSFK